MSKLNNIHAIREMLAGTHRFQTRKTVGFSDAKHAAEQNAKHEIGDVWNEYDIDGNIVATWEQCKGYRKRIGRNVALFDEVREYLNQYPNCLDDCRTEHKTKLDSRFRAKFGRCADCQFRIESKMKLDGTYKEYERQQMLLNAQAFFSTADSEIELVCSQIVSGTHYANSNGTVETWTGEQSMADQIKSEYNQYKQIVLDTLTNQPNQLEHELESH